MRWLGSPSGVFVFLFFFGFVFILFSRGCPPLICVVCGNGELGKFKHRGKDVVRWPAGASFRRQQRPDRAGAGTAATPGLDSSQPPARPPPLPASRLGRSGPGRRARGERGGIEGSRRRGGRGCRRGRGPPRGGPGRRGRWAVASARPRPRPPAAGREGGEPPLAPEVGPAALAGGRPEQPQNKTLAWGIG